ncbi:hypothetical protein D1AOALGA4SA_10651 [Olavius algarvensis Delta 1 endosymbiont]|nr:hypothetical protein D1AOALGA4SA_10651 [Olavius algarvensis Delta 1 endosymbiont]
MANKANAADAKSRAADYQRYATEESEINYATCNCETLPWKI